MSLVSILLEILVNQLIPGSIDYQSNLGLQMKQESLIPKETRDLKERSNLELREMTSSETKNADDYSAAENSLGRQKDYLLLG